jgi:hypothetical protein
MAAMDIHVSKVTGTMRLRVRGLRAFAWRCRLAAVLFELGGRVAGIPVEIDLAEAPRG